MSECIENTADFFVINTVGDSFIGGGLNNFLDKGLYQVVCKDSPDFIAEDAAHLIDGRYVAGQHKLFIFGEAIRNVDGADVTDWVLSNLSREGFRFMSIVDSEKAANPITVNNRLVPRLVRSETEILSHAIWQQTTKSVAVVVGGEDSMVAAILKDKLGAFETDVVEFSADDRAGLEDFAISRPVGLLLMPFNLEDEKYSNGQELARDLLSCWTLFDIPTIVHIPHDAGYITANNFVQNADQRLVSEDRKFLITAARDLMGLTQE